MRIRRVPLLAVTLLGCCVLFVSFRYDDDFFALKKSFQIFSALYEELIGGYVDPLDAEKLMNTGIEAMLADLDPYTSFIDEADQTDVDILTRGTYGGVGLNIGTRGGKITVISPVEGASGYKQGVRAGDVITHIAGKSTRGMTFEDLRVLLRGDPGTAVAITVQREGTTEPIEFLLTREEVKLRNVTYAGYAFDDTASAIAYVRLERFSRGADAEVLQAIQNLQKHAPLKGLVLDLRDNPGGLLDAAVRISQFFVPPGALIVETKGRMADTGRQYFSQSTPAFPDLPLVVLTNELSASASEIVAGAIQDLDRGVVVGAPTFGKGLVQVIKPLPYNTSIKMTTARYFTPSGRSIQAIDYGRHDGTSDGIPDSLRHTFYTAAGRPVLDGRGIEPDVPVSQDKPGELEEALGRRAAFFFFANHYAATHPTLPTPFQVDDAVVQAFREWLVDDRFTYRTEAERTAEELESELGESGYAASRSELAELKAAMAAEKAADFDRHRDRIRERLRTEITARYFGERAQIRATLTHDAQMRRAIDLLKDLPSYHRLLAKP